MQIAVTSENAGRLAKHCELTGWSPEELANHPLAEPLDWFDDPRSGSLEQFFGAIDHPDPATTHRALPKVAQIVTIQFGGRFTSSNSMPG
jgi:hypothetical protein